MKPMKTTKTTKTTKTLALAAALTSVLAAPAAARQHAPDMDHAAHAAASGASRAGLPTMPGQDAYGAIGEIVRILRADPATDWSRVDLEALRQHLIDMNAVTLGARVARRDVAGGLEMQVTGEGRATDAIRRMTASHGRQLASHGLRAVSEPIPGGARFTVTAADASDAKLVAMIRGLGFIGIMTLGDHHMPHHLMIARGERH